MNPDEPLQFPGPDPIGPWAAILRAILAVHAARLFGPLPDDPFDVSEWVGDD